MMHHTSWCSSSHMVGHCNCGLFHHHHTQTNSFSMLFSMPNNQTYKSFDENDQMLYPFNSPPSVDCTLSLGTPSTRLTSDQDDNEKRSGGSRGRSNFSCWDFLQPKDTQNYHNNSTQKGSGRGSGNSGGGGSNNGFANSDPLLARRCANCDTTSTPLWRNGPRGPKSLCNACGIRYKKEKSRATAANASATGTTMDHHYNYQNNSWVQPPKMTCFSPANNEFRFIEDNDYDTSNNIPFLSWRLSVTDSPSLVHDFTR